MHLHIRFRSNCRLLIVWLLLWALPALSQAQQVEVRVEGDFPQLQDNAEAFIGEVEGRSANSLRRYADTAESQVKKALRALGYYSPGIQWEIIEPSGEQEEPPRLILTVQPGQPVHVRSRNVEIEGPASEDSAFTGSLPRKPSEGDVLNHGEYSSLRQTIQNRASLLGYFDGEFTTRRLEVDPEKRVADITLVYRSGERYRLGEVSFSDGHGFEQQLLEKFVRFEPGETFHADKIARLNNDLSNSGYFSSVDINASPGNAEDGVIPVEVGLTTRPPRSVAAGVGFSTDVGPRLRGNWREHWVNPMGHSRGVETELSVPRQNLSTWYELPLDPPMTDSIRLSAGYQREEIEDVESELLTLGQQWKHQLDNGWQQVASLRWEGERFRIGDDKKEQSSLLLPGLGYSKLNADSPLNPSRGYRVQFDITGSHRAALSNVDILHANFLVKGLYTLADNHRFLTRFQFGGVATNRFSDVPPSLRFFAGGDQSVRGYGYETLSPRDEEDVAIGGRYLMVGSAEYQYQFAENWRVAAFVDEGNAMDDLSDPLATGAGLGIRWISPVGSVRLDIAKGLDPEFGGEWRVHFSMGPEL
ncbi:autotransporter assembly complex family protein [Marinobacter sp. TBZ242]|uniref:Translocation and assembly module subunit TamA n=1 Tax=Marinobacter azerbaijanicus TaxID=3050455 RepID=A0ABT7I7G8_9GAMM|nr:autotransporter assembly complex family protein [Marinobacter sp. TBZ242]MDL0430097.1 autotransporter assembly complex family protein [Marinobacter sp. TBZ242]